ncbi:MAG: hypothetical protein WC830_00515 [Burkholderiales bacterium]|jgi:hypothetical protein
MLNHIYGLVGVGGLIVTVATSFIKDQDAARWVLVASGWLACLIVAISTNWGTRRLTKRVIELEESLRRTEGESKELKVELVQMRAISSYLATTQAGRKARPRQQPTAPAEPNQEE